jgi:hypothetical protein
MVMAAPLWLVGGFALDLLRKLPAGIRWALLALLRALGVLAVLPLTPFVFVWAFLAELFRPKHQPPARFSQPPNGRPKSSTWPPGVAGSQKQKSRSVEAQKPKNSMSLAAKMPRPSSVNIRPAMCGPFRALPSSAWPPRWCRGFY